MIRDRHEDVRRAGAVINFLLSIALLVTSSIYLTNLDKILSDPSSTLDPECVTRLLPSTAGTGNSTNCANPSLWRSFAILGIVRGCLYFVQIVGGILCSYCLYRGGQELTTTLKNSAKFGCVSLILSLALAIIPIYLAVNLSETEAIHAIPANLSGPALAMFIICILEMVTLCLGCLWILPVMVGTVCGACALCFFCCACKKNVADTRNEIRQKVEFMNISKDVEEFASGVKIRQM